MTHFDRVVAALAWCIILACAWAALALPVRAQDCPDFPLCQSRSAMGEALSCFGEAELAWALQGNGLAIEVWANMDTGSWTITSTDTAGFTCVQGHGHDYTPAPPLPTKSDRGRK